MSSFNCLVRGTRLKVSIKLAFIIILLFGKCCTSSSTHLVLQDDVVMVENAEVIVLRLAQCRATCLSTLSNEFHSEKCWKLCRQLEEEDLLNQNEQKHYSICTNTSACEIECRKACQVYEKYNQKVLNETINLAKTNAEGFIAKKVKNHAIPIESFDVIQNITLSSTTIILPIKMNHSNWVYSFLELNESNGGWKLYGQTNSPIFTIYTNKILSVNLIRVFVVGPQGLRKVFKNREENRSRAHRVSNEQNATTITKSPNVKTHYQDKMEVENPIIDIWKLQASSLIHQKFVVLTEVSWDFELLSTFDDFHLAKSNHPSGRMRNGETVQNETNTTKNSDNEVEREMKNFLLTWEMKGSFIRGNLITDISHVLLTLWQNTSYIVQVNLISRSESGATLNELQKQLSHNGFLPVSHTSKEVLFHTNFYTESNVPLPLPLTAKSPTEETVELSTSSIFCSWKEPGNSIHFPLPFKVGSRNSINHGEIKLTSKEISICFIVWGVIITCFVLILIMLTYFFVLFYLAAKKQQFFKKLHSQCSVANIYRRNLYRMRNPIFPPPDSLLASATESLEMDDSCSDVEENDLLEDKLL